VLRRLDCVLAATKPAVLAEHAAKTKAGLNPDPFLQRKAKQSFYNTWPGDLAQLLGDQDHIRKNLYAYVRAFSPAARDIFERFDFYTQVERLANALHAARHRCRHTRVFRQSGWYTYRGTSASSSSVSLRTAGSWRAARPPPCRCARGRAPAPRLARPGAEAPLQHHARLSSPPLVMKRSSGKPFNRIREPHQDPCPRSRAAHAWRGGRFPEERRETFWRWRKCHGLPMAPPWAIFAIREWRMRASDG
jgi:hypothetical protein